MVDLSFVIDGEVDIGLYDGYEPKIAQEKKRFSSIN
jgi:hypothetical protein